MSSHWWWLMNLWRLGSDGWRWKGVSNSSLNKDLTMKVCVAVLFDRWDQLMTSRVSMYKEWTTGWVTSELQAIHKNSFPEIRGGYTNRGRQEDTSINLPIQTRLVKRNESFHFNVELWVCATIVRTWTTNNEQAHKQKESHSYLYWNATNLCGAQWQRLHILGNVHSCTAYTYRFMHCLQTDYGSFSEGL